MSKYQSIGGIPLFLVACLMIQACEKKEEPKATAPAPAPAPTTQAPQPAPAPAPQAQAPSPAPTTPVPPSAPAPVSEAAAPPPAGQPAAQATQAKQVIASSDGEKPGARVEVQELKRVSGGTVMLRFTLINDSDSRFDFGYNFAQQGTQDFANIGGVHLIDPVGKKKYLVVRDSQNNCDCSRNLKDLDAKSRINLWARFPAPPDNVEKIAVVVPHFSPMDDVPLSR